MRNERPFKRGDVVEYIPDGSIYVLDREESSGHWLVGTIVECAPDVSRPFTINEGNIRLLRVNSYGINKAS